MVPVLNIISPLPILYWHAVTAKYTCNVQIPIALLISGCAILYGNEIMFVEAHCYVVTRI